MRIGSALRREMDQMSEGDDKRRLVERTRQVQDRYRTVIEKVYRTNAQLFLNHTNNVYLFEQNGRPTLIVYMDESIFAAELNAQRELIRFYLQEMFGEEIDDFKIAVSRGSYKRNYIYKKEAGSSPDIAPACDTCTESLSSAQVSYIEETTSSIDNEHLRSSIKKAMTADLKRLKQDS